MKYINKLGKWYDGVKEPYRFLLFFLLLCPFIFGVRGDLFHFNIITIILLIMPMVIFATIKFIYMMRNK